MTLTLLLDLDDTLIENDIDKFLPSYLKALSKHLSPFVAPDVMVRELLAATEKMVANRLPNRSLEEVFDADFYPRIGVSKEILFPVLTEFYETVFPTLKNLTRPRPAAVQLVEKALARGFTVVVATNPLFPARAIQHRLSWGNLGIDSHSFSLVSSYEKFHFAKPNPAFYAECLGRVGWPNQPAVMVGNSLSDDLIPAGILQIPGFWINENETPIPANLPTGSRKGKLEEVESWLDQILENGQSPAFETTDALLAVLASTPAVLDAISRNFTGPQWNINSSAGEWCFAEILCHLRDADLEINLPRFERVLNEPNPFLPSVNADAWSETRNYCSEDGPSALRGFIDARIELLHQLSAIEPKNWGTSARHAIFGPTTILELVSFIAQHDRTHIQQALQTVQGT